jgi:hypothetical protein
MFLHSLLNALAQIANNMGLLKTMGLGSAQLLREMSIRNRPVGKVWQQALKADKLSAIY